jgi:hypothetical protein
MTDEVVPVKEAEPQRRKAGRPKKGEIVAKKRGSRELRGRPKGDAAIMNEYKARMLASPKSAKVLEKVFEIALNDDHAGQMAAMKLVLDRIVPASAFDTAKGNNGGSAPQITINVSGISAPSIITEEIDNRDIEDIEYKISDTE